MISPLLTQEDRNASRTAMRVLGKSLLIGLAPAVLAGCVQVSAPNEPIEINLNINIRQEVVVRLQEDVRELIQQNPGVF